MAKIYGLFGSMTGKLADTVMSVRNGEQIARKYQPTVFNPSTPAQVAQRAKLKLLSQMSAVMGQYLAIQKQGSVSSRNIFTKVNFPAVSFADNTATAALANIQLTNSNIGIPNVAAGFSEGNLSVGLSEAVEDIDRVVYVAFRRTSGNALVYNGGTVVSTPGTNHRYVGVIGTLGTGDTVVYAYAVKDIDERARMSFGNLEVVSPLTVASLITSRALSDRDILVTKTSGILVTEGE